MNPKYVSDLGANLREQFDENLEQIRKAYNTDQDNVRDYRKSVIFNLVTQWTAAEKAEFSRNYKVSFEFNQLYPYIRNIIGEQLQNTPDILLRARNIDIDDKKTELMEGAVRYITYASKLPSVLQTAAKCSLIGGWGAFYVMPEYENDKSFNQILCINKIVDSTQAYFDSNAKEDCKEDGEFCGITHSMNKDVFKSEYSNIKNPISIGARDDMKRDLGSNYKSEEIVIAEHWKREYSYKTLVQLSDGTELYSDEVEAYLEQFQQRMVAYKMQQLLAPQPPATVAPSMQSAAPAQEEMQESPETQMAEQTAGTEEPNIFEENFEIPTEVKRREVRCCKIMYYKMIENALLEKREWPSKYLPVIYVPGDDFYIEGKRRTKSCTRYAIDAQRFYNYTMSTLAEVMKQTRKEQWLVSKTNVQSPDVQEVWRRPDQIQGALIYETDPETKSIPIKVPTSELPQSWIETTSKLEQAMQNIVGRHEASMGQPGNEISGIAVSNRIVQSSLGAYTYFDGINKACEHLGRVLVDMVPRVNDTERDLPIITRDGKHKSVRINKLKTNSFSDNPEYENELSQEYEFDIEVQVGDIGPLQKQEALNSLIKICELQETPLLMSILDKIAENLDIDNAKEIRDRWVEFMPPQIKAKVTGEPPPPPQPNPQQQMMEMQLKAKMGELQNKQAQTQLEKEKIQQQYQQMMMESDAKERQAQLDLMKIQEQAKLAGVQLHNQALRSATELATTHAKAVTDHMHHKHSMENIAMTAAKNFMGHASPHDAG